MTKPIPLNRQDPRFRVLDTEKVSQEIDLFATKVVKAFSRLPNTALDRGIVAVLRETKFENHQYLTKYLNINILEGPHKAVNPAKQALDAFLTEFKGTFETQSKIDIAPSTFTPKL